MLKYSESPLSQLPYLELFLSVGGASQGVFWGGQSRDIFRGGPVKKITLYVHFVAFVSELKIYFGGNIVDSQRFYFRARP